MLINGEVTALGNFGREVLITGGWTPEGSAHSPKEALIKCFYRKRLISSSQPTQVIACVDVKGGISDSESLKNHLYSCTLQVAFRLVGSCGVVVVGGAAKGAGSSLVAMGPVGTYLMELRGARRSPR